MTIARGRFHHRLAGGVRRAALCLTLTVLMVGLTPSVGSAAVTTASVNNQNMLSFMNAERAARGLSPLSRDPRLDALAQSWANKMAAARTMYHPGTPQAMSGAGYRSGAQNLAWHDTTLTGAWAHNFWMNSAPHRKNILDPAFTHTGIAMACNPNGGRYPYIFATVEFGGNSSPSNSTPPVSPHVAGSQSAPGAGCDGGGDAPPPAPPQPAPGAPPPAPAPAPLAAAKPSAKASPSSAAAKKPSPSPSAKASAKASASPSTKPSAVPSATPSVPLAAAEAGSPSPSVEPAPSSEPQDIKPVNVANSESARSGSGPLIALVAGLSGILLATRVASRHRRPRPKHAISRH
ncbi:hypothetical protein BH23ACT12_BH23ACT12_17500 [soil metagenome]